MKQAKCYCGHTTLCDCGPEEIKQTTIEWLEEQYTKQITFLHREDFNQAKEMEKQQIIDAGNSCALKQHLHIDRINKMSMEELEQYNLEASYTFGEEYYNEIFKNKL